MSVKSYTSSTPRVFTKARAGLLCLGLLYYILLMASYILFISPGQAYLGLVTRNLSVFWWIISILLSQVPLLHLPIKFTKPSDLAAWYLYLLVVAPCPLVSLMVSTEEPLQVLQLPLLILSAFFIFEICRCSSSLKVPLISESKRKVRLRPEFSNLFFYVIPVIMLTLSVIALYTIRFNIDLSISDVYTRRLQARETVIGGSFVAYSITFLGKAYMPLSIVIGLYYKKSIFLFLAVISSIAVFSVDGSKGSIFTPLLIVCIILLVSKPRNNEGFLLLVGCCCIIVLSIIEEFAIGSSIFSIFIVRRLFIIPAQLTTYYWEFFSYHPLVFLSDSILKIFINPQYPLPTAMIIGLNYFQDANANANAGIWASGFANFGYVGVIITSIIAAVILRIVDSIADTNRYVVGCVVSLMIGIAWTEQALHTSILSSGIIVLIIGLYLCPSVMLPTNSAETSQDNRLHRFSTK